MIERANQTEGAPILVTGGGGFLGSAIVKLLRERGEIVRSLSRSHHAALDELGAIQILGDVADPETVSRAVSGCKTVFHVAAKAGLWGPLPGVLPDQRDGDRECPRGLPRCTASGA